MNLHELKQETVLHPYLLWVNGETKKTDRPHPNSCEWDTLDRGGGGHHECIRILLEIDYGEVLWCECRNCRSHTIKHYRVVYMTQGDASMPACMSGEKCWRGLAGRFS